MVGESSEQHRELVVERSVMRCETL